MVSAVVSFFRALARRSCFLVFLCTLSTTAAYAQLPADVSNGTFSWSHCRILEEEQLFERLNAVTQAVFQGDERSHGTINAIDREFSRGWIEHNGDAVIDAAVSAGADRILAEEGRGYVILSGWSMKKANKIVLTLSYYVLDSTDVRELVTTLAAYAAKALEPILIETLARSAHAGVACLEEFTRNSFPAALTELFEQYLGEGDNSGITMASADIIGFSLSDLLAAHRLAAAGVVAVVAAQIAARIAPLILSRLGAGIVAATVPILGWTIGVTLVVSDLIVNLDGALGIAEKTLTAAETKKDMRHQLRETILEEMRRQTAGIALAWRRRHTIAIWNLRTTGSGSCSGRKQMPTFTGYWNLLKYVTWEAYRTYRDVREEAGCRRNEQHDQQWRSGTNVQSSPGKLYDS